MTIKAETRSNCTIDTKQDINTSKLDNNTSKQGNNTSKDPSFTIKNKSSQIFTVFFNILKACIGGGILEFPYLYATHGALLASIYTVIFGFISYCGCVLYMIVNEYYGRQFYIGSLAYNDMSWAKVPIDVIVVFKCIMVSLSYFALILETATTVCNAWGLYSGSWESRYTATAFLTLVYVFTIPFILSRDLGALKKISFLGMIGASMLLGVSTYYLVKSTNPLAIELIGASRNPMANLGSFVFSYTCHQNILTLQNESTLKLSTLLITIGSVYGVTTVVYILFGMLNYSAFHIKDTTTIQKKIFDTWPPAHIKTVSLLIYVLFLTVTIPLHVHPIKTQVAELARMKNPHQIKTIGFAVVSLLFIISGLGLFKFATVSRFVSQTFSAMMVFIIPGVYYFRYKGIKKWWGYLVSVLCILTGVLCLVKTVLDLCKVEIK